VVPPPLPGVTGTTLTPGAWCSYDTASATQAAVSTAVAPEANGQPNTVLRVGDISYSFVNAEVNQQLGAFVGSAPFALVNPPTGYGTLSAGSTYEGPLAGASHATEPTTPLKPVYTVTVVAGGKHYAVNAPYSQDANGNYWPQVDYPLDKATTHTAVGCNLTVVLPVALISQAVIVVSGYGTTVAANIATGQSVTPPA